RAAGRPQRPDVELLHRAIHQRHGELGHGVRTRRTAAGRHAGAVCDLSPRHQDRAEPGLKQTMKSIARLAPVFPAYATLGDKLGWWALRALCVGVLLFLLLPILVIVPQQE